MAKKKGGGSRGYMHIIIGWEGPSQRKLAAEVSEKAVLPIFHLHYCFVRSMSAQRLSWRCFHAFLDHAT